MALPQNSPSGLPFGFVGLPPDVRQGFALALTEKETGLCPSYGLWPKTPGQSPNVGHSPRLTH